MTKLHHKSSRAAEDPNRLLLALRTFIESCRRPALWEDGEDSIELKSGSYSLEVRGGRLWIEVVGDVNVFSRRILHQMDARPGTLLCAVQRFGRPPGRLSLLDLDRPSAAQRLVAGQRHTFAERFRLMLSRQFPDWRIDHLSSALDLHRSFSSVFPRAHLVRGTQSLAALACPSPLEESALLTSALLWFDYLHSRHGDGGTCQLALFLPEGAGCLTAQRLRWLSGPAHSASLYLFNEHGSAGKVDPADLGNLESRVQSPDTGPRHPHHAHVLAQDQPEARLERAVRQNLNLLDAALLPAPVHTQVLTFVAGDRNLIDLLAVTHEGRLCVIELKVVEDLHLPLQALDYWMRVHWHAGRADLQFLFPSTPLSSLPPRLLLVAPAQGFHSTNATILRHFSPEIEVERIGVNSAWYRRLTVVMRLRGANSPSRTKPITMSIHGLTNIRKALSSLNPKQVRDDSERPVRISLHAPDADAYRRMESFFLQNLQPARRNESAMLLSRGSDGNFGSAEGISIFDERMNAAHGALIFHPEHPATLVQKILDQYPDNGIALARHFQPFRNPYVHGVIKSISRENTLFSLTTALPDVIPSFIELPWALAEFASDSAFLTMNQVRMAFLIAAASDRAVGYMEQKSEIAAVIGSAFGWRALARQVVGKIPFGGGLIGKAAIAYAGTRVLGMSLDRYYNLGYAYNRDERHKLYQEAFEKGKNVAQKLVSTLHPDLAHRLGSSSRPVSDNR